MNLSRAWDCVQERFLAGLLIAHHRAVRWSLARRAIYLCGSFLIPVVLIWRIAPGAWRTVQRKGLPWMTFPVIVAGMIIKAVGEFAGYAGFPRDAAEREMHEYEMHKLAYVSRAEW